MSIHSDEAQVRIEEVKTMRAKIPNLVLPTTSGDHRRLIRAATLPPEFIELTAVAVANSLTLVREGGPNPDRTRDLMSFADAYEPLADELEALAQFLRFSITAARYKAGTDALTTYALAKRLARRPETADLAPHVEDMRRALKGGR